VKFVERYRFSFIGPRSLQSCLANRKTEKYLRMLPACSTYRRIGFWGILALVALRILVGWHFYMEGAAKVREGKFTSVGFLSAAKGPLADNFHGLLPDYDGKIRLDKEKMRAAYKAYYDRVRTAYSFNADQTELASKALQDAIVRWDSLASLTKVTFYNRKNQDPEERRGEWASQIEEYIDGFDRMAEMAKDMKRSEVASLRGQRDEIETKWRGLVKPVLADIDKNGKFLEERLAKIATPTQRRTKGEIPFDLSTGPMSVRLVDKIIPIFDMSVGILLIVGLLTPLAGLAAGIFLASVVLTQFPGAPGTLPTYYQAIEMVACFVIAFADAGRFAGLDFFPWSYWNARAAAKS
jgi:uncharacterized membrane protein YphA (DoxX/SURF4 family)